MDMHSYLIQSELDSKSYLFIKNDKIISLTNLFQHLLSVEILSERIIEFIFSGKFSNPCKEQPNRKVPSNILLLYKASS